MKNKSQQRNRNRRNRHRSKPKPSHKVSDHFLRETFIVRLMVIPLN